jgi:hypothetical protein
MHGLVLIVTIIMPKIHFLDIDVSVVDLKNLNFNLCNFLTPVESIVIIKSMKLANILAVKFFAILVVVLLVKLKFLSNVFVGKMNKEFLVRFI